jgi:membrane-bound ClpP family serine protease
MLSLTREHKLILAGVLGVVGILAVVRGVMVASRREQPELPKTSEERLALAVKMDEEALATMTKEELEQEFRTRRGNYEEAVRQKYGEESMATSLQRVKDELKKRGLKEPR